MSDYHQPSIESAFTLPEDFSAVHPDLTTLYHSLIVRLRHESKGGVLGLHTVHELLLERIAFNYVMLRARERGWAGGFNHATAQKDANTFWLTMTQEFNRMVRPRSGEEEATLQALRFAAAVDNALSGMHPDVAAPLRERFAAALDEVGL